MFYKILTPPTPASGWNSERSITDCRLRSKRPETLHLNNNHKHLDANIQAVCVGAYEIPERIISKYGLCGLALSLATIEISKSHAHTLFHAYLSWLHVCQWCLLRCIILYRLKKNKILFFIIMQLIYAFILCASEHTGYYPRHKNRNNPTHTPKHPSQWGSRVSGFKPLSWTALRNSQKTEKW